MTRLLVVALISLGTGSLASAAELPGSLVEPYLRVQAMLAADKIDGVKASAGQIATAATSLGADAKKLADAARRLEQAGDLKAARDAFGSLNDALFAYAKATGATNPAGIKTAYCPMNSKSWLQKGDKIQNPYYGTEMLECGVLK